MYELLADHLQVHETLLLIMRIKITLVCQPPNLWGHITYTSPCIPAMLACSLDHPHIIRLYGHVLHKHVCFGL